MFADDSVICSESKEHVGEKLERWIYALERRGMQGNRMGAKVAVRPAMLYGLETVALTKIQEAKKEVVVLKMLRFSLGVTRMDRIRNE